MTPLPGEPIGIRVDRKLSLRRLWQRKTRHPKAQFRDQKIRGTGGRDKTVAMGFLERCGKLRTSIPRNRDWRLPLCGIPPLASAYLREEHP